jgi:hypothetical protein
MGTTANRNYPYPDPTDPADFPQGMQDLAEAVDTDVQALVDSLAFTPFCVVTASVPQSVSSATTTELKYDTVTYDNDSIANLGADAYGLTPPTSGLYFLHFSCRVPDLNAVGSGKIDAFLRVAGADFGRSTHAENPTGDPRMTVSGFAILTGSERVAGTINMVSGAARSVYTARLAAYKVA